MVDNSRPGLRRPATKIAATAKLPVLVVAMLVVVLSACSARQTVALREDGVITKDVQARLAADPVAREATIGVETKAGIVSLSGAVATDTVRDSAERIARDTPGVTAVDNDLRFGGPIGAH
jgi:hypothetical protein